MKQLKISDDLALPVDAATQTFLVVGKRGSGKSNTAARIVEQLLQAKVPVVIFDPVDCWYGLKASRDGQGQGYGVYVFGGRHKDVDLKPEAGALIAEFLCEHRAPLVLSCKHLSGLERSRFMVDFALTLYRKWTGGVLHLVLEEAHELAPQAPPKGEKAEEMLGAFKKLWKLGRSSGIGGTAVTQRPASLSKDITTQSEILVVHRTIGPQDVEAVKQWIKYHRQGFEILPELATLKTGEAFVWAPEFPEEHPIGLRRVQVLPRETFDSASTPKAGEQRTEPKDLAPVDLERLKSKMAATFERQKAEDPRELQKTVRELRAQVAQLQAAKPAAAPAPAKGPRTIEKPVLKDAQIKRLDQALSRVEKSSTQIGALHQQLAAKVDYLDGLTNRVGQAANEIRAALAAARAGGAHAAVAAAGAGRKSEGASSRTVAPPGRDRPAPVVTRAPRANEEADGDGKISGPQQKILDAAAFLEGLGVHRPDVVQLGLFAGLVASGGYWRSNIGRLRSLGLIEGTSLTDAGRAAAREAEIQTVDQLHEHVLANLVTGPQATILRVLIAAYPAGLSREELGKRADMEPSGGYWRSNLGRLRSLGLVSKREPIQALPVLFLEGA